MPVQIAENSVTVAATTNVKAFASNVTAGNLLIMIIGNKSSSFVSSVHDNLGNVWTAQDLQGTGSATVELWYTVTGSSGACTVTVTYAAGKISDMIIAEYAKAGGTPTFDTSNNAQATVGTSLNSGNITTSQAVEQLIAWGYNSGHQAAPWTDSAGFTKQIEANGSTGTSIVLFDNGVTSIGTYSDTLTGTNGVSGDNLVVGIDGFFNVGAAGPPVPSCNNPPGGSVGNPYSQTFTVSGGTAPFTWSVTAGALPPGLNLNTATGVVSGTPTQVGTFNFTITVTDAASKTGNVACSIVIHTALQLSQLDPNFNSFGAYGGQVGGGLAGALTGFGSPFLFNGVFYMAAIRLPSAPGIVGIWRSTDGKSWTELASGTGPSFSQGTNNPIVTAFDGDHTVWVCGHTSGGALPLGVSFASFNLNTNTWSAPVAAGGGFLANSLYDLTVVNKTTLVLIDVYVALVSPIPAPGRYINVSQFSTGSIGAGPSTQIDAFTNAQAVGVWTPTRSHIQGNWLRTLYVPDDNSIVLFFNTFSFDVPFSNRCFMQKYFLGSSTAPAGAGNFFDFPGQNGANPQDLIIPTNGGGPLCAPLLVPISGVNSIVMAISKTMAAPHTNLGYPTLYVGTPATAPVWTEFTSVNGIDASVAANPNLSLQTGIGGAYDPCSGKIYFVWVTSTADSSVAFAQIRLATNQYNGTDPTVGWTTSQLLFDMTTDPGPGGGGHLFYPGNTGQQNLLIPSIMATLCNWMITVDANVPATNYATEARYSFAAQTAPVPPSPPATGATFQGIGGGTQVVHGGCKPLNEFDYCLLQEIAKWNRLQPLPVCSVPQDLWTTLPWEPEWGSLPALAVPFRKIQSIITPAAAAGDQVVSQLIVPQGYDGLLAGIFWRYNGVNFIEGSGDIFWRIQVNQRFVKDLSNVGFTLGSSVTPMPMTEGQQLQSRQRISVVVNVPNISGTIQVGTSTITGGLFGFFWPKGVPGWTSR